jgi:hypothetical protein
VVRNPSRDGAEFQYSVREPGKVSLRIYDLKGAQVAPNTAAWNAIRDHG